MLLRRHSERIAHGDGVFSWRYSERPTDGVGAIPRRDSERIARDSRAHKRPTLTHVNDRACGVAAKQRATVGRQSVDGTA